MRVLEHISRMGHREVARSYAACAVNLFSAGGAGLITAVTIILKTTILHSPLALLASASLIALDFIVSFLFMQVLGFKLATKQSPFLGAALGAKQRHVTTLRSQRDSLVRIWRDGKLSHQAMNEHWHAWTRAYHAILARWRAEAAWTLATQSFSALGNLLFVGTAALGFHLLFELNAGKPFLDAQTARETLLGLDPWRSGSLAFAALTGVLIWVAAYLGGVIGHRLGPMGKAASITFFNVSLGAMLAFVPALGRYLGLPLDVRHFTLSGGTVVMAAASLGLDEAWKSGLSAATLCIFGIGALNFSVSFALAFASSRAAKAEA